MGKTVFEQNSEQNRFGVNGNEPKDAAVENQMKVGWAVTVIAVEF